VNDLLPPPISGCTPALAVNTIPGNTPNRAIVHFGNCFLCDQLLAIYVDYDAKPGLSFAFNLILSVIPRVFCICLLFQVALFQVGASPFCTSFLLMPVTTFSFQVLPLAYLFVGPPFFAGYFCVCPCTMTGSGLFSGTFFCELCLGFFPERPCSLRP